MSAQKCILLNPNRDTSIAFRGHFGHRIPVERYKSEEILLHLVASQEPLFLSPIGPIDFHNAYVFVRMRGNDSHFCGMLTEYFKANSIPTNDPVHSLYKNGAGKVTQMLLLSLKHIRIPESIIFREESFARHKEYIRHWASFPLVYKTDGRRGRQVHIVHSFEELEICVQNKKRYKRAVIQPFLQNTFDTRTLVAYGEVLGTIKRTRTQGYLNNISQGGIASAHTLTDTEKLIALRAAEACRIDFAGVDMIHTDEGPIVLEVNKSPQVLGFDSVYKGAALAEVAKIIEKIYFT
jgi:glutathione synthase/RimK-type ligase-like ATP-grasp enzyme